MFVVSVCVIVRDYVREEVMYGYEGALYLDSLAFNRFVSALTSKSQCHICSIESLKYVCEL